MKEGIHPAYGLSQVTCACGHAFSTRSTKPEIRVEICSQCHPFFTGRQKLMDTAGRVERFKKRFARTEGLMVSRKPKAAAPMKKLETAPRKKVLRTTPTKKTSKTEKAPKKKA